MPICVPPLFPLIFIEMLHESLNLMTYVSLLVEYIPVRISLLLTILVIGGSITLFGLCRLFYLFLHGD